MGSGIGSAARFYRTPVPRELVMKLECSVAAGPGSASLLSQSQLKGDVPWN